MAEFAEKFKQLREQKQLSLQDVAKRLLIQTDEVQKWENGEILPDTLTMMKLSEMFGVSLDYLIRGEETATIVYSEKDARQEFTDAEVHRIAYKYLIYKLNYISSYFVLIAELGMTVAFFVMGIVWSAPLGYGMFALFLVLTAVSIVLLKTVVYRLYIKEKTYLENKYGSDFMKKVKMKLLSFDRVIERDKNKTNK